MASSRDLLTAIKATIEARLPALAAAEGLPAITRVLRHAPPMANPTNAPEVWIALGRTTHSGPAGFGGPGPVSTRRKEISIIVTAYGQDTEETTLRLCDYADLIEQAIKLDPTMRQGGHDAQWIDTSYTDNLLSQGSALYRAAVIRITVSRWAVMGED